MSYEFRPFNPGKEKSITLTRHCGPECTEECSVIISVPGDLRMVHGIIHRKGCSGKDTFSNSVIDEVIQRESKNVPPRLMEIAREYHGYNPVCEIVMRARAGKDYKAQLKELKPIARDIPGIQEMVKTLYSNLAFYK